MGNLMGSLRYKEPRTVEECDSTWESDSESDEQPGDEDSGISECVSRFETGRCGEQADMSPKLSDSDSKSSTKMKRSFYAAKDLYKYRHSYPNNKAPRLPNDYRNLRFYLNKIPLIPDGIFIEEILTKWRGNYDKLEHNHTYIQWLFPLREQGLNFYAQELTQEEIKEFQSTREAKRRFLLAYTLMLDFYGIKLLDKSGNVARASNWQERFQHLNESQHNYLRITRILKSLGELGFEAFKAPLVRLLLDEALCRGTLPNMLHSTLEYYVYTIRLRSHRRSLLRYARQHYQPANTFLWGPSARRRGAEAGPGGRVAEPTPERERRGGDPHRACSPLTKKDSVGGWGGGGDGKGTKGCTVSTKTLQEGVMERGRGDRGKYIETVPL
ncbi:opioid growth factor receptor-like protein 1 [Coregonus clupeaformis]|uniref:Opioid growth factor receptor (OGFr) conserved domain-containing protein n=1 Tax=Coregonus suidteri TaxID=861788 RepID=A0AAN8R6W0_9TELE|nr:opioid growth factor receptor-like protein 1 [Coregonus clupeaformis]